MQLGQLTRRLRVAPRQSGPRPMVIWRDLGPVADLLQLAFAEELRLAGHSGEEIGFLKRLAPFIAGLAVISPQVRNSLTGFVWEEDRRVVGNVNLTQTANRNVWMIGNVAVHPRYRRRGIARRLTELAVEHCIRRGAASIALEVRRDNTPAYHLYETMGFTHYDSTTRLLRHGVPVALPPQLSEGVRLRPEERADWPQVDRLIRRAFRQEISGLGISQHLDRHRTPLGQTLGDLTDVLSGRRVHRLVLDQAGDVLARLCVVASATRAPHRITLVVDPLVHGQHERTLVQAAFVCLPENPRTNVLAEARTEHGETVAAFAACGFETVEVLDTLVLKPRSSER